MDLPVRLPCYRMGGKTDSGGINLLRNLHQVELADEIDRLESDLGIPNAEENGA